MASIRRIEGKDGVSFKITVSMGRDADGKQVRHYRTWKPEKPMSEKQMAKEAGRQAYEFEREISEGFMIDNKQTFAQYAEYVYTLREQRGDTPSTLSRVKRMTKRINSEIGHMKLAEIRPQHLNMLYKKMAGAGYNKQNVIASPLVNFRDLVTGTQKDFAQMCGVGKVVIGKLCNGGTCSKASAEKIEKALHRKGLFVIENGDNAFSSGTIRDYHAVISTVFAQAEREMIIPYNPAQRVSLPKLRKVRQTRSLQPEEIKQLLIALEDEPLKFRTMIMLFLVTGCRRGEVLGLKWEKVDFLKKQLCIDTGLSYTKETGIYEGETKTGNTRFVTISDSTAKLLRDYRIWHMEQRFRVGDQWKDTGFVFTRWDGTPENPGTVNVLLDEFCKRHDLPHIHPHMFRHTAASMMISNGVDILTVSKMLGHSSTSMTLDIYAHEIEEAKRNASECISDAILKCRIG